MNAVNVEQEILDQERMADSKKDLTRTKSAKMVVRENEQTTLYKPQERKLPRETHVIVGMFPNVQNTKLQVDADSENNSASIAIHIP